MKAYLMLPSIVLLNPSFWIDSETNVCTAFVLGVCTVK